MNKIVSATMACLWALAPGADAKDDSSAEPATAAAAVASRPTVGLVLGGGGALGFAHIGVLRVLEAERVPIDYIGGTSMGAIVAGLYACGVSPDEIQAFLEGLDWNEVMSDATPRRERYFRRKQDDQRYLFEMGMTRRGPKLGTGVAAGQKFTNLMQWLALRAASVTDFDRLPIPYRAVATDLESGEAYVIDHGNLAVAMRASMAVPGAFTPVEIDGRLLVDGGIVNNLPVDVVKAMGAEIVIAVDVGAESDKVNREKLQSLGGILGRTYAIAQRPNSLAQLRKADVAIQPPLAGFTAAQFHRVSELIPRGETAARAKRDELSKYSVSVGDYAAFLRRQRRPAPGPARIDGIEVVGERRVSEAAIRGRIFSRVGEPLDPPTLNLDLMRIYGIGEFEQVLFRLALDEDDSGTLRFDVKEKPWGPLYLAYGLQLQSDFEKNADWSMLLNLTRMSVNRLGAEWRNDLEVGSVQKLLSEFYQPLDMGGILFLAPAVEYRSEIERVYKDGGHTADYDVRQFEGRFDAGVQLRRYAELRVGPVWGSGKAEVETGSADLPRIDEKYAGGAIKLVVDQEDRTFLAREGYFLETRGIFARESMGGERDFDKVTGVLRWRKSFENHTFILGLQGGTSLGSELPGYAQFTLGGPFGFAGLAENQFRGSYLGVVSTGYRYRLVQMPSQLGRGLYALARLDTGNVWQDGVETEDVRTGAGVGVGADTVIGPLYFGYGRTDDGESRFHFTLGTVF